ncbi:MAG: orotidine-5'-phosphate decarboxylase [Acidobacteriaceae bacterium]
MAWTGSDRCVRERLIVALDVPDARRALELVERMEERVRWFKVGLELYLSEGNQMIEMLRGRGFSVFLDLKLHDIPKTVAGAVQSASRAGAEMLTLHAGGGPAMMAAAVDAASAMKDAPLLLAVTVLTSMDDTQLHAVGVPDTPAVQVLRLARTGWEAGIRGFVGSAEEAGAMRREFPDATLVIPGIRPAGSSLGDQKRVATPQAAMAAGADYLVVGRPITRAADPAAAAAAILEEIRGASVR